MTKGTEQERKIAEAIERGDAEEISRLMPMLEAAVRDHAEQGDVGSARLLYEMGRRIDPALCGFAPAPRSRFASPPRPVRRRAHLAEMIILRGVVLVFACGWVVLNCALFKPVLVRARGDLVDGRVVR